MKINNNISAVITNKQLLRTEDSLAASMERLSSGIQINHAGDDPSGIAIASKMQTQIDGLDQASENASDGMSVLESADGALNEVMDILQRMRELAVQADNGTNSISDREAIQAEIDQLKQEVDRVSETTEFNTKNLLDGSLDKRVYSKGVDRVQISDEVPEGLYKFTIAELPTNAELEFPTDLSEIAPLQEDCYISINGHSTKLPAGMQEDELYEVLRETAEIGEATISDRDETPFRITAAHSGAKEELEINISPYSAAKLFGFNSENSDPTWDAAWCASPAVDKVDMVCYNGKTAELFNGLDLPLENETTFTINTNTVTIPTDIEEEEDFLRFLENEGLVIVIPEECGEEERAELEAQASLEGKAILDCREDLDNWVIRNPEGDDRDIRMRISPAESVAQLGFDAPEPDEFKWALDPENDKGRIYVRNGTDGVVDLDFNEGSAFSTQPQATVSYEGDRFYITDTKGFSMNMLFDKELVSAAGGTYDVELDITEIGPMNLQVGANEGQQITVRIPSTSAESLYIDDVDVVTVHGADRALNALTSAINRLSEIRSDIGAYTNRLEHSVKSLDQTNENMNAAISRLQDTNMAKEMSEYTKFNVLQQAATSALAQANELPQTALQLLG